MKYDQVETAIKAMNDHIPVPQGYITVWSIDEKTGEKTELFTAPNQIQYFWAYVVAKTAGHGDPTYKLSSMYFEFKNVTLPTDIVTVPTFTRGDDISYYTALASPVDFLRVPMSSLPSITIQSGFEPYFTPPKGNVMNFFAQTSGTTGYNGVTFSAANNSKVYGVALVATPTFSDQTQDILFARSYFSTAQQQLKVTGSQIGVTWSIPLL